MARVKILSAAENHELHVSNIVNKATIPVDGEFHEIHDDLVPVLEDSGATIEIENADATGGSAEAGAAAGLGGSAAAPPRKARKKKAKH